MTNPLNAIPQPSRYPRTSRYYTSTTLVYTTPDGQDIPYLDRRILPQPSSFTMINQYQIRQGDRLDVLAYRQFGDAGQWWQLADANPVIDPSDLTDTPGRWIRVTLPAGVPGAAG